jgi:hypothetical protein
MFYTCIYIFKYIIYLCYTGYWFSVVFRLLQIINNNNNNNNNIKYTKCQWNFFSITFG